MLIRTLTRRVLPGAAIFAVLGGALVAQDRLASDTIDAQPAIVTDHDLTVRSTDVVEERRSEPEAESASTDADHVAELNRGHVVSELAKTSTKPFSLLGVTWASGLGDEPGQTLVEVRTRQVDGHWTGWQELHIEPGETGRPGTEPLWVGDSDGVAVRVLSESREDVKDLRLSTIQPGAQPEVTPVAATVGQPTIIMRSQWGAAKAGTCDSPIYGEQMLGAVIHHTAGSNSYTKAQAAGLVQGVQSYHMKSRGWCDIGYNFLVDKYGQIFEGRGGGIDKMVRAAHSGNGPVNQEAIGVSMMGTFSSTEPSDAMKKSVADLVAWRFSLAGVPAKGTYKLGGLTLNRISGHRNVVSTECPGAKAYAWLSAKGGLRDAVEQRLVPAPTGVKASATGDSSVTVSWTAVPDAARYGVKLSTDPRMWSPIVKMTSGTSIDVTGLKSGTTYYVQVSVLDEQDQGISAWSTQAKVTTPAPTPTGVKASATSSTALRVSWTAVPDAAKYAVKVSADPRMWSPIVKMTSGTSLDVTGLKPDTTYYAQVVVLDSQDNGVSAWSDKVTAKTPVSGGTGATPPAPSGVTATATGSSSVKVSWTAVPDAARYGVKLSTDPRMWSPIVKMTSGTSIDIANLKPETTYYVQVAVLDAQDRGISPWSEKVTVETPVSGSADAPVPAPSGVTAAATGTSSVKVSWTAVPDAARYGVKLSTDPRMWSPIVKTTAGTSLDVSGLTSGTTYYVQVSVLDAEDKGIGPWSDKVTVMTPAEAPSGVTAAATGSSSVKVAWTAEPRAARYGVKLSKDPRMWSPVVETTSASSLAVSGLSASSTYYVQVAVLDADDRGIGPWSDQVTVKTAAGSSAKNSVTVPSSRSITVKGHGYGHGIGMSQYGAEGGARAGKSYDEILAKYYPGTKLSDKSGSIRVLITADTTASVVIEAGSGITFHQGSKEITLPTTISGKTVERWTIDPWSSDKKKSVLRYRVAGTYYTYQSMTWTGDAQFEAGQIRLVLPSGKVQVYRTAVRSAVPKTGSTDRNTVNVLSLENYTRGVVAREMPSSWHAEALKAQSVAARTYGAQAMRGTGYYDICDTTSCQVYGGVDAERSTTDAAITATKGKILTYDGSPALAQFSSSSGGYTNQGSKPYLKPVSDSWDGWSGNANHSWSISVKASTIEKKYTSIGTLKSLSITQRNGHGDMGGRVTSIKLVGSKASKTISGVDARWAFGLRSDWFGF